MTGKTKDTPDRKTATETMAPLLMAWQAAGLGPLNWLAPTMLERMSDMGSEWFHFVATRVQEDVALQHALLHAKTPAQAQAVQMEFLKKAVDQYSAETGKLVELSGKLFDPADKDGGGDIDNVNV